jgi:hypothetical protein
VLLQGWEIVAGSTSDSAVIDGDGKVRRLLVLKNA